MAAQTFSGLLNVIDGALGHNKGLLMILTTNRYSRLCDHPPRSPTAAAATKLHGWFGAAEPTAASVGSTSARFFKESGWGCFHANSSINPDLLKNSDKSTPNRIY